MSLDLLLFHAYRLADDPREQELMRPFPPLGLQSLVAWLRRERTYDVDWFDLTFSDRDAFFARCDAEDPHVVGLYGHTITRPVALPMVARCRAEGRRVVAGGPDPVQYLEEYLEGGVEVVVIGEGEHTLTELMDHLHHNHWQWDFDTLGSIRGIAFRAPDGTLVRTEARPLIRPLETLPWPARERRDLDAYLQVWRERHGETALSLATSRGCPYHCSWCSKQVYGDTFRRRSPTDVVSEVLHLRDTWNPDQLWFVDDMFTINKKWVKRFATEMVERDAVLPFYLIGRPETLTAELCHDLRRAGCYRMYVSAESGAEHVLEAMDKGTTVAEIKRGAGLLRDAGIELGVFVMLGYPGEELADVHATLQMLRELTPEVTLLSVAHPMKGTSFYERHVDKLLDVPGWTEAHGGRLPFSMRYPWSFYELSQRTIWARLGLDQRLREQDFGLGTLKLAAKYPVYRAGMELLGRTPEGLSAAAWRRRARG